MIYSPTSPNTAGTLAFLSGCTLVGTCRRPMHHSEPSDTQERGPPLVPVH